MNVMFNVAHELIKNMISQMIHIDLDKKIFLPSISLQYLGKNLIGRRGGEYIIYVVGENLMRKSAIYGIVVINYLVDIQQV